jgi:hypothetical protein
MATRGDILAPALQRSHCEPLAVDYLGLPGDRPVTPSTLPLRMRYLGVLCPSATSFGIRSDPSLTVCASMVRL